MTPDFASIADFLQLLKDAPGPDPDAKAAAIARNGQLTKPAGSLGRLESLAIWYASWRGDARARITSPQVIVFAGNHGVAARGVSAFPAEVTAQMVANFEHGGAAINQLAKLAGARLDVHALDLDRPTQDFTSAPAMSEADCVAALALGWSAVDDGTDLLVVGEMGIANTTSAAAIALALFGGDGADWVGRGTGVDDAGLALKAEVIRQGLTRNPQAKETGLGALAALGGREIAAMAGAIARARMLRVPVILDGFICCAAAACLARAMPGMLDHAVAGHEGAEAAHRRLLEKLGKPAILSLDMRLGEASGGALAINILRAALACHCDMSTFAEAGVSGADSV